MLHRIIRPVSMVLILAFCMLNFHVPGVQAQMLGTDAVIAGQQAASQRAQVADFLAREDVKLIMIQHGVDPMEAQQRVASLSVEELSSLANSIDQLPAGGSAVGTVVGAALIIFIVLLITDIVGLTHVFPFVNHPR